jgi:tetratricopeptide (TPR) repeat protein
MRMATLILSVSLLCPRVEAQSYDDLFREAAALSAEHNFDGAIGKYKAALQLRPGAAEALSNLGVIYHLAGRYQQAVETMDRVIAIDPKVFPARLILGLDLVRLDRSGEAIPHLRMAVVLSPGNTEAALGLAAAYVAMGRLQEAADEYEAQTRVDPRGVEAWYGLGLCYERLAEAASRRLSRMPGGASLNKQFLTEFLIDRGEFKLAEESMREMAELSVQAPSPDAKQAYDEARRLAGRSRHAFLNLVDVAPRAWQSRLFLADLNRQQRKFPEAIADYRAVERMMPQSPAPKLGLATVYWELGQFEQSEEYLNQVLKMNPQASLALFELGNIRVRQNRDSEAIPLLKSFLAGEPDSLSACADLGRAYYHLGRNQEALVYLEKARAIDDKGDIHYQLAMVLKRMDRGEEAEKALRASNLLRQRALDRQQRLRGMGDPGTLSAQH